MIGQDLTSFSKKQDTPLVEKWRAFLRSRYIYIMRERVISQISLPIKGSLFTQLVGWVLK